MDCTREVATSSSSEDLGEHPQSTWGISTSNSSEEGNEALGEHPQRLAVIPARKRGRPPRRPLGGETTALVEVPQEKSDENLLGEHPRKVPLEFCRGVGAGPMSETLAKAAGRVKPRRTDDPTSPFRRLADMFLHRTPHFMAPLVALSKLSGMDKGAFVRHTLELANACFRGSRMLASYFLSWLLAQHHLGALTLVSMVTACAYDSTPMKLSFAEAAEMLAKGRKQESGKRRAVVLKLLQTEVKVACLVRMRQAPGVGEHPRPQGGTGPAAVGEHPQPQGLQALFFELPCLLQTADRGTGETTRACLQAVTDLQLLAEARAIVKVDVTMSLADRGSDNLRAERSMRRDAGPNAARLYLPCEIHK